MRQRHCRHRTEGPNCPAAAVRAVVLLVESAAVVQVVDLVVGMLAAVVVAVAVAVDVAAAARIVERGVRRTAVGVQ